MIFCDIETRSRVDLKKSNVYRYAADPDFRILMLAYAADDGPVEVTTDPDEITRLLEAWVDSEVRIVAHNAAFERICFSAHLRNAGVELEGRYLRPGRFDDTMPIAAEHGYPVSLEALAEWLDGEQKDKIGVHLINYFSKPTRAGDFRGPEADEERWAKFVEYCRQDVETLRSVWNALPGWPTVRERRAWLADQAVNDRGIRVDVALAEAAVDASDQNRMIQEIEFSTITGVSNPGSTTQLLSWFNETGLELPNVRAETVASTLLRDDLSDDHRRALELRRELALSASKKYIAALDRVDDDGRLRGSFQFFGAHTGRWAGRGVQLQNLPAASIKPTFGESIDDAIAAEALDVTLGLGGDANTLKALVRSMFLGPFTVVDYSAIEARVLAWLAGEEWALEAFASGRDIYVETAKRMGNLTRKEGKVATLALGYGGGLGALRTMGAQGSDEYLKGLRDQWREANENIVALWDEVERKFWTGGSVGDLLSIVKDGDSRYITLPSGRSIGYHSVLRRWAMTDWGTKVPRLTFRDPRRGGARVETYGGRLTENITQAVARDVLSDALIALTDEGFDVVGHVHDEVLVEGESSVAEISKIMTTSSKWSAGLPLDAEGYQCPRYRKD